MGKRFFKKPPPLFEAETFEGLLYRVYTPNVPDGEKVPLVLFLHGSGERGDDNKSQLREPLKIPKLLQKRTKYDIMKAEEGKGSSSMKLISLFAEENRMQKLSALGDWGCRVKHFLCNMI